MKKRYAVGFSLAVGAGAFAVACSPDAPTTPKADAEGFAERGVALDLIPPGQDIPFIPVASSATCTVGGRGGQQLVLPQGYIYSVVASEGPGFGNNADMNTVNEGGPFKGRFLYRTHETTTNACRVGDGSRHGGVAFRCAARGLGALRRDRVDAVEHDPGVGGGQSVCSAGPERAAGDSGSRIRDRSDDRRGDRAPRARCHGPRRHANRRGRQCLRGRGRQSGLCL